MVGVDNSHLRMNRLEASAARDNSDVTALYLDLEPDLAEENLKTNVTVDTQTWDLLRKELLSKQPEGYDLVHVARYLHRPLMPILRDIIKPGGFIVYSTFMVPSMGRPKRPRFLLDRGELVRIFEGYEVFSFSESHYPDGRPAQYLCARKPK